MKRHIFLILPLALPLLFACTTTTTITNEDGTKTVSVGKSASFNFNMGKSNNLDRSKMKSEERKVDSFTSIQASSIADLNVSIGSPQQLKITCNENSLPKIRTNVEDGVLRIETDNISVEKLSAYIVVEKLSSVELSGAAKGNFDKLKTSGFEKLKISGASSCVLNDLDADSISVNASGSSSFKANGKAKSLNIVASGASTCELSNLESQKCTVNVAGSSRVSTKVIQSIEGSVSGASSLIIKGNPKASNVQSSGASSIRNSE